MRPALPLRYLFCLLILVPLATPLATLAVGPGFLIGETHDLHADLRLAAEQKSPLLLLFSQGHCNYCLLMKQEVIDPMILSGDYDGKILFRELRIDEGIVARDILGRKTSGAAIAEQYGIDITPTLLYLDPQGREIAERTVGISNLEYLYYYMEQSVQEAISKLAARQ